MGEYNDLMTRARTELEKRGEFDEWYYAVQLPATERDVILETLTWAQETGRDLLKPFDTETYDKRNELRRDVLSQALRELAANCRLDEADFRLIIDLVDVVHSSPSDVAILRGDTNAMIMRLHGRFVHDLRRPGFLPD